eukprot:707835-Amphidinium_carterae.1
MSICAGAPRPFGQIPIKASGVHVRCNRHAHPKVLQILHFSERPALRRGRFWAIYLFGDFGGNEGFGGFLRLAKVAFEALSWDLCA